MIFMGPDRYILGINWTEDLNTWIIKKKNENIVNKEMLDVESCRGTWALKLIRGVMKSRDCSGQCKGARDSLSFEVGE